MGPIDRIQQIFHKAPLQGEQLHLPFDVPGEHSALVRRKLTQFAATIPTRLGTGALMKVGVPVVASTTPAVISLVDGDEEHGLLASLVVGTGLGGAWGAMVGATIPQKSAAGFRIPRIRAAGNGMARGMLLAPAVSLMSKYVADVVTSPLEDRIKRDQERSALLSSPATR